MRIFVTGATGFIGSALVRDLLTSGHTVVGLARSDSSADKLAAVGAETVRGSLTDLAVLRDAAADSDGVAHLGYVHDFSSAEAFAHSAVVDRAAVEAMAEGLAGSDKPLVLAAGVGLRAPGRVVTEADRPSADDQGRGATEAAVVALGAPGGPGGSGAGVRGVVVRFAPTVHGDGDPQFVPGFVALAREKGRSAYVGDGANRWCAVHRVDAARLFALALEKAPAGSILHAVAEESIAFRDIAEAIGRGTGLPTSSLDAEEAGAHFGFMAAFAALDMPASSALTRELVGWEPTQPGLLEDMAANYFG